MDDLIKRSDAIEAIEVVDWYHQNRNKDMVSGANDEEHQAWYKAEDVYKALEEVPSADRPQGWIPCSERLPKKYGQVLCCNKDGRVFSSALTYMHPEYKYWYFGKHRSVIAWMPLPEPWKGADDE